MFVIVQAGVALLPLLPLLPLADAALMLGTLGAVYLALKPSQTRNWGVAKKERETYVEL